MPQFMESDIEKATVRVETKDGRIYSFEIGGPREAEASLDKGMATSLASAAIFDRELCWSARPITTERELDYAALLTRELAEPPDLSGDMFSILLYDSLDARCMMRVGMRGDLVICPKHFGPGPVDVRPFKILLCESMHEGLLRVKLAATGGQRNIRRSA